MHLRKLFHFKYFDYILALLVFLAVTFILFWQFFVKGLIPIPGDILIGTYYPWINHKWGFDVSPPVKNPLMSDVVSLMYPWRKIVVDYLQQGQLPLWDPTSFMGQSLIGNLQAAIFNPFNILFFLMPFNIAWGWQVVIQPFMAMCLSFILFKRWKLESVPSLLGAIGYGLSAPMLIWMEYNVLGFLIVLFPAALLFVDQYLCKGNLRWLIGLSFITAMGIFAGYIQMLYYVLFFSYLYGLGLLIGKPLKIRLLLLWTGAFIVVVVLGLLLAAVQLVPGFEAVNNSIRNLDIVASGNAVTYLPWSQLLTGLVPDFYGNPATYNYFGRGSYESFAFYTSVGLIPFACWAFTLKKYRRLAWILFSFIILSLLLALWGPVSALVQSLSFLGLKGSVSSRVLFIFSFGLSALAALGLQTLMAERRAVFNLKSWLGLAVLVGVTGGVFICWVWINKLSGEVSYGSYMETDLKNLVISLRNCILPLSIGFVATVMMFVINKFPKLAFLLIIIVAIDMFRFGFKYLPFTDPDLIFPETSILQELKKQQSPFRIAVEKGELLTANTWSVYGLQSVTGYNILLPRASADFVSVLNNGEIGQENARFLDIKNFDSPLLDLANTEYVMALLRNKGVPEENGELNYLLKNPKYQQVHKEGPVVLLKNTQALPRFFVPEQVQIVSDQLHLFPKLINSSIDLRKTLLTDQMLSVSDPGQCEVILNAYRGQDYTFKVNCLTDSVLVVSEAFHAGWKAKLNDVAVKVYPADGQFLAIVLPAGTSELQLYFWPDSVKIGFFISGFGIMGVIILWFLLPSVKMVLLKS